MDIQPVQLQVSVMSKSHATVDECLLLIKLKREAAFAAMKKILVGFGLPPHHAPDVITMLDYLTNMVYCIELMLKLLSDDWVSHNVAKMYETAFGRPHANQQMMAEIKTALLDQKYLFEPKGGLISQVADMEKLNDELVHELRKKHDILRVEVSIPAPPEFMTYLRTNAGRIFEDHPPHMQDLPRPRESGVYSLEEYVARKTMELKAICDFIDEFRKNKGELHFYKGQFTTF